jgi:DNA polymerase III subunit delta
VEEIKRGMLDNQYLVVSGPRVDKRYAFYKTCDKLGRVQTFNPPEKTWEVEQAARAFADARLRAAGIDASEEALALLAARTGTDSRQIAQEVEKLLVYLGDRKQATEADVRDIVSPAREALGWDLADAVGARDAPAAIRILRQLLFQKEQPVGLLSVVEFRLRELGLLRSCIDRRWLRMSGGGGYRKADWQPDAEADRLLGALTADPRKTHPYRLAKLGDQALQYTAAELAHAQQVAFDTHEKMVSTGVPPDVLLEVMLVRIVGGPRRAPARA